MNQKKHIIIALIVIAGSAWANSSKHGPFPDDAKVERVTLFELSRESDSSTTNSVPKFTFPIPGQNESRLVVVLKPEAWFAELIVGGKTILQPTAFSNFSLIAGLAAYSADLNQDRVADFVIYTFSGGSGLASGHCNVAFLLSSGEKYALITVATLFPDESDFIMLNKKPHFVHASFFGVDKCNDGKHHNFWVYNLLAFGKDGVKVDNSVHSAFPKIIWNTFKPNHAETTLISDEQKVALRKESLTYMFWKKQD